ncbi:MAG: hypothetical protein JW803_08470 [Endomicrobiales bacterium]|nr:hypothetical protein [Endomicrobiales bacterium]
MGKVKKFIKETSVFIKNYPNPYDWDVKIVKEYKEVKLNEKEYLKVQDILANKMNILDENNWAMDKDREQWIKYLTCISARDKLMGIWEKTLTEEQIVMGKIRQLIIDDKRTQQTRIIWVKKLEDYLVGVKNKKKNFSYRKRNEVMNELIDIFTNNKNSNELRYYAAKAWVYGETREDIINKEFEMLKKDEYVFEKVGSDLWFLNRPIKKEGKLHVEMFEVLENSIKYPEGVVKGALEYFIRDSMSFRDDSGGARRERLKRVLSEMVANSKKREICSRSAQLLEYIQKNESRGKYK